MLVSYADHFSQAVRKFEEIYPVPSMARSVRQMAAARFRIEEKLKDAEMGEPNPEIVRRTLEKFFRWERDPSKARFSWLEVAMLCRGLLTEIEGHGSLMQSESAIGLLLTEFTGRYHHQVFSPYPWRGLLSAYLNCPAGRNAVEIRNRHALREFLLNSLDEVAGFSRFKPRWLEGILAHRIVLKKNAARLLAEEALQGRHERVERVAEAVDIPPTSWFWPELIMAQVDALTAYPDDGFKQAIDPVLRQLQKRRECLDKGLASILDRYALCLTAEPHERLLAMAVSRWKSPSLERQGAWQRVSPKAKRMVQKWLVPKDIEEVFRQLAEDNRRHEFWLQYLDQIEYTHIWMGGAASEPHPLAQDKDERRLISVHPEKPDSNLILIKIGGLFIVESAVKTGGKCWAYREDYISPLLSKHGLNYAIFRDTARNVFTNTYGHSDGLIHSGYAWEKTFRSELAKFEIFPDPLTFDKLLDRYRLRVERLPNGAEKISYPYGSGILAERLGKHQFTRRHDGFYRQAKEGAD